MGVQIWKRLYMISADRARIGREKAVIGVMVGLYCRDKHEGKAQLCESCRAFLEYARNRLDKCPFGSDKPTCARCPIHCHQPAMRELAQVIMRYSGPRMLRRHPLMAIRHLLDGRRSRDAGKNCRERRL